jgi:nifR3 family TIM-barrel protein
VKKQLKIDTLCLDNQLILAPLPGYSDLAFRLLCRRFGAGLCYSEMISCHGLAYQKDKTIRLTQTIPEERPVALQLFGADPDIMGRAAAIATDLHFDIIDINMGCPVKKVVKKGAGAALMINPKLAAQIITAVKKNTTMPVTIKIRTGWSQDGIVAPDFAKMAEDNGASAVAVHGRTWSQGFGGQVDWQTISLVKKNVTIPVIGNGDITSFRAAMQAIEETGCDGIMIGRAALGNPWVFTPEGTPSSKIERMAGLKLHLENIQQFNDPGKILPRIKNQAGRYFKGIAGGSVIRKHIYDAKSFAEIMSLAETVIS